MPISGGPYLVAALFCEKVLREADGVLTFVRAVDRWTVTGPSEAMPTTVIQTTLVVMMKSGIHRGSAQLTVTPTSPSGAQLPAVTVSVLFEGDDDRGIGLVAPLAFPAQEAGVYWFDVAIDGQSFTNIPLRVIYLKVVPVQMPPTSPGPPGLPPG